MSPDPAPTLPHVQAQYATAQNLQARIDTHQRYTIGPALEDGVDATLKLTGTENMLDVGCGPGSFLGRLAAGGHTGRLLGVDLSAGMTALAAETFPDVEFQVGDAQALPFPNDSFDVVTARHMLYHVPDVTAALQEFRRVLRPGGLFLAVTNAAGYMQEWWDAFQAAMHTDSGPLATRHADSLKFTELDGALLIKQAFGNVQVTLEDSALLLPTAQVALPYFRSLFDTDLPAGAEERFQAEVQRRLTLHGRRISKRVALLTANKQTG